MSYIYQQIKLALQINSIFNSKIRIIALLHQQVMIFVFRRKIHTQQLMNTQLTQQGRRRNQMYKRRFRKGKTEIEEAQEIKAETKAGYTCAAVDTISGISPTQY
ncbi:Hypothetical_protein [Hexamita inflata]|uniref:Hypothetical_protein n=1 Tax=Hexamita inflata TaxID=28002 RepID=A0AA86Q961_9EUKA|nr:Hypothetical protein HINF_LOCUS42231 [Hexamita inflata]